jgi:hypothetical protein
MYIPISVGVLQSVMVVDAVVNFAKGVSSSEKLKC